MPPSPAPRSGPAARQKKPAHRLFFPAAALYAALILPLSLQAMTSLGPWLPALSTGMGHAHEMLFGFALAVLAGYLLGPLDPGRRGWLFGSWLLARFAFLAFPGTLVSLITNTGFAVLLAWHIAPRFLGSAKKWRNKAIAPILIGISTSATLTQLAFFTDMVWLERVFLLEGVLLFSLLMLFMGGRLLAPAVAGHIEKNGGELEARVQPRIEGALILAMGAAIVLAALPWGRTPAALACSLAGALALVRLLRWQLWQCRDRPDLISLGIGYGWLGLGLLALGAALTAGWPMATVLHLITIGALGTLTSGVMGRVWLQRGKHSLPGNRTLPLMALLIALALLARLGGAHNLTLLWVAAGCWSAAFLLLNLLFVRTSTR